MPILAAGLCLLAQSACRRAPDPNRTLRTIAEIWKLTPSQASRGYPVELQGYVRIFDPQLEMLTVQDGTAGIYVEIPYMPQELSVGQRVEVSGFTGYEARAPVVVKPTLKVLTGGQLPAPQKRTAFDVASGRADYQWVETEAQVISRSAIDNEHLRYQLRVHGRDVEGIVQADYTPLIPGSEATVQGVPVALRGVSGEIQRVQIFVPAPWFFTFKQSSADPGAAEPGPRHAPSPGLPVLTNAGEFKRLQHGVMDRNYPVQLRGVVTMVQQRWSGFILQDATAGLYVDAADQKAPGLRTGDAVEVKGVGVPGSYAPSVESTAVRVMGRAPLPAAHPFSYESLMGPAENQLMIVSGVVRSISTWEEQGLTMALATDKGLVPLRVVAPDARRPIERWLDSDVSAVGVGSPMFDQKNRILGVQIVAQTLDQVRVAQEPPDDPFARPAVPIGSMLRYNPKTPARHRIKVAGTVTLKRSGLVYLADETGGVRLQTRSEFGVEAGDRVEAVGFPPLQRYRYQLDEAVLRKTGAGRVPAAIDLTADEAVIGLYEARLVRIDGFLVNRRTSFGEHRFTLQAGRIQFAASLQHPQASDFLDSLREGSLLRITGICSMNWDDTQTPPRGQSFRLLVPAVSGIQVLRSASFWTLQRALSFLALMSVAVLLVLTWVAVLRRRVTAQTVQIRERIEHEARLRTRLEEAERMESLGRLAGGVAHDFNNLLTVINGYADLLLSRTGLSDASRKGIDEIRLAGRKAAAMTLQLLTFSRKQVVQPRVLDLNTVVQETEPMLRRLIPQNIRLEARLDAAPCNALADSSQFTQVLLNLCVNARDAMPEGGSLTISTDHADLDGVAAGKNWHPSGPGERPGPGRYVLLSVADTGTGIDEVTRAHMFEPFFTTKEVGKGTGLGLATVYGIVRQSGGYIRVQSSPGAGSVFTVCLPRAEAADGTAERPAASITAAGGGQETILIVEDQPDVRDLVGRLLRQRGYVTLEAAGGSESLELLKSRGGPVHLMITDVVMPGMTGLQLAEEVKRLHPNTRVLFMSGYARSEIDHQGLLSEGVAFLQKPFTPEALEAKVHAVLS